MDAMSSVSAHQSAASAGSTEAQISSKDAALLKKSQDLAADQAQRLTESLPKTASPQGMGNAVDLSA